MWRTIDMRAGPRFNSKLEWMCRQAVDFSCAQLVEVCLNGFGSGDLLQYITDRSSHIKRLQLVRTDHNISDKGLSKAAAKLPLLEELELLEGSFSQETLEVLGCCCPHLQSLKFNFQHYNYVAFSRGITSDREVIDNKLAMVIAKNMPKLCHLELQGNKLTDVGLQAILDGCPHLESLDLYLCPNVRMGGSLHRRCVDQLKHLCLPNGKTSFVGAVWQA